MVKISDFIKEEINHFTANLIIEKVDLGKKSGKCQEEIIFNRYSLEIYFLKNIVLIYDDIFNEEEELSLDLEKFIKIIECYK